jgi:spore coat polysaccharide biosynthesis protein SpsF
MKKVALIQARMSSSRLPGKVLKDIVGSPMLIRVIQRAVSAKTIDLVAVITSNHADDNAIEQLCDHHSILCYRGSLNDVLDRYYEAALHFQADVIVRITADCPLLDPIIVDKVIDAFQNGRFDYVSNTLECTYPDGLDTEVFRFETLKQAWQEAALKSEREHVTAYMVKHPEFFRLGSVKHEEDLSSLRWTVDTPRDLEFIRCIYKHFGNGDFGMEEILAYVENHPEIQTINAGQERNEGYHKSLREDESTTQTPG